MATKTTKGVRLEQEIDRNRDDSNWRKVRELAEQLRARPPGGMGKTHSLLTVIGQCFSALCSIRIAAVLTKTVDYTIKLIMSIYNKVMPITSVNDFCYVLTYKFCLLIK